MTNQNTDSQLVDKDHLVIRHPDGSVDKILMPEEPGSVITIGRELDNDVTLSDARVSRHHAKIRRAENYGLEVTDVGSANGTIVGSLKALQNEWSPLAPGQVAIIGDTRFLWEQALSSQTTVGMTPVTGPAPGAQKSAGNKMPPFLPWLIGAAALLLIIAIIFVVFSLNRGRQTPDSDSTVAGGPVDITQQTPEGAAGADPDTSGNVSATDTPTSGEPLAPAAPSVSLQSVRYLPVISGALFDSTHVYMIVEVRVANLGDAPFVVSTNQFSAIADDGETLKEFGQEFPAGEFKRLGVVDRFDDLSLGSGGSVAEELVFYLETKPYNLTLNFEPYNQGPLQVDLGSVNAGQELAVLLGTPAAEPAAGVAAITATPEETPTPQAVAAAVSSRVIPNGTLLGTIAYGDFNGATYDLYFGNVATGETTFWRGESSQPTFSHDATRIAFHSWANDSRGLINSNLDHSNGFLVGTFNEDQLPTWSPDNGQILFLTRRTGTRQSQLLLVPSAVERPEAQLTIEGEYPSWHSNNTVVFKGWVTSGEGLRVAPGDDLANFEPLTDFDGDTAPAISPDGSQVIFMSNRNNNWDIYVVNIDGSGLTRLTTDEAQDGLPTWSPDGKAIAFVSNRGGPWAIWAMTPTGSGIRQLFTYQGSPDGFVASEPTHDTTRGWAEERISWTTATP